MTGENKKENIKIELDRASNTLQEADLLFKNGFTVGAISRLYYFLFYNLKAQLLTIGLQPKSHEGTLRLFGLHFVKKDIFEPKTSHIFAKLMKFREEADYNPYYTFEREDFLELKKEVEWLAQKIQTYIKEKGYFP